MNNKNQAASVNAVNKLKVNQPLETSSKVAGAVPDDVKAFLDEYYPNGLVYFHNSFLAYSNG